MKTTNNKLYGIILALIIAIPAWMIGNAFPIIGSPVLGILFGMVLAFWKRPSYFNTGVTFTAKKLLQYSIILMGFGMNLFNVFKVGKQTILLMLFTLTAAFITAYIAGKLLKINGKTATLIGVGSSICGGSAIAATAPVINANEQEVAHSISTIFLFNAIAAFLFPFLGHLFNMSNQCFGLWAGTAVNDTSSVVAAGYSYSTAAGNLAVIVKLTRTLAIVPITLALAIYTSKKEAKSKKGSYSISKIFPWFVLGFVAASVINTFIPVPAALTNFLSEAGKFVIVMAMVSVGLNTNIVELVKNGVRPIVLGFTCWVVLALTSLGVQHFIMGIF
ncbi:YeiH family protein [Clostridium sp. JS66]|uniref:YeiH family protein n=1 Tax=Clostridium sp. JS66 TaxID=3064705 RepID=UPI00298E1EE7|nr:YeiH family protein [Clostridium sp. JS66]WPC43784.1 YeiH family protein [Clostridium sp. JS66]